MLPLIMKPAGPPHRLSAGARHLGLGRRMGVGVLEEGRVVIVVAVGGVAAVEGQEILRENIPAEESSDLTQAKALTQR